MAKPRKTEEAELQKARTRLQGLQDKARAVQREMAKARQKIASAERRDDLHFKAILGGYLLASWSQKPQQEVEGLLARIGRTVPEGNRERYERIAAEWMERQQKSTAGGSASPSGLLSQLPAGSPPQS